MENALTFQQIVKIIQIIMICMDSFFLVVMIKQKESSLSKTMLCIAFFVLIQNVGYYFELNSKSVDAAMVAVCFEYVGNVFITTFTLKFIMKYCGEKINELFFYPLYLFDIIIIITVWFYSKIPVFYTSVEYVYSGNLPHLELGKGILYFVYIAVLFVQEAIGIFYAVRQYRLTSDRKSKNIFLLIVACGLFVIFGFGINYSGILKGYDFIPIVIAIVLIALGLTIVLTNEFDIAARAYENIIKEMNEAVIVIDPKCGLVNVNISAQNFLEQSHFNVGDKIINPDIDALVRKCVFEGIKITEFEFNDSIYEVHMTEINNRKRISGYVFSFFDITAQRKQLESMKQLKIQADEANRAKSDFLARMSHEIRSPINAILGMNEMILRESNEEDIKGYALDAKNSTESLLRIVNDLLDSAKIASGKMEINPVDYKISSFLLDIKSMIYVKSKEKKLALRFKIDENIPSVVYGDDVRVKQILLNLLYNAVKYTSKGGILFTVTGDVEGEDVILHCCVKDTGIGIKPENISHLFDEFERINVGKNRYIEGTGLGLNITSRLLMMMGSKLKVESTYGEGSSFYFDLKQKIVDNTPVGKFQREAIKKEIDYNYNVTFTAPEAKILVVDDSNVNLKVFISLLKNTKVNITTAISGVECLELVKENRYDLIFLDHMMPKMDGVETLYYLQNMPENKSENAPIIMLTANASEGAKEQYIKQGFDGFLSKPINSVDLEKMICNMLPENLIIH